MQIKTSSLLAVTALILGGCSLNTPIPDAAIKAPAAWNQPAPNQQWPDAQWWQHYQSPELEQLLQRARADNLDLASAASRLLQADAQLRQSGAALLPQLNGGLNASRTDSTGNRYTGNLNASYEVDFWGRNRAAIESARASLAASHFDRDTLAISIDASVASTWFQVIENRQRNALARDSLEIAERVLELVEARYQYGAADSLELSQQRTLVAQLKASLPNLEQQGLQLRNTLALLLGQGPDNSLPDSTSLNTLQVPDVSAGLPSELLERRPDIRASEARLTAANADLTAARAALYPGIQLTAQYGVQSLALSSLLSNPATSWTLAAGLTQPIFQGGRLRAQVDLSSARQEELLIDYRRTLLSALGDADSALGNLYQARLRHEYLSQANAQAERAFNLAETRYRAGAITLQTLLDTQRTWYQSQDSLAQQQSAWLQASVDLFRALGGGWQEGALSYSP